LGTCSVRFFFRSFSSPELSGVVLFASALRAQGWPPIGVLIFFRNIKRVSASTLTICPQARRQNLLLRHFKLVSPCQATIRENVLLLIIRASITPVLPVLLVQGKMIALDTPGDTSGSLSHLGSPLAEKSCTFQDVTLGRLPSRSLAHYGRDQHDDFRFLRQSANDLLQVVSGSGGNA